jgi:nicotinate phosphoribosyltransferase
MASSALFTDFYELTMAQGFWKRDMDRRSVFEMFFRKQPFSGGFSIFAGLGTLLPILQEFSFSADDIAYLRSLNFFESGFLEFLSGFKFRGKIYAMDEGTVIFPQEPLIRVEGTLIECQIIEGIILCIINFQSLIATKSARVWLASAKGAVMDFGLRRAQGPDGALSASRAAFIGGARGTSNVLAAKMFGIKPMGTMAHSWVMSFPDEEAAFNAYADLYPKHPVFLIDTYDTLKSGIVNALKVGRRLAKAGGTFGVRLDSGDIQYLSVEVRRILDAEGFTDATIAVSNDLDETIITALVASKAPIDNWGVGTRLVTGAWDAAFTGVYKLASFERTPGTMIPAIKLSDNPEKTTNPAVKQVWRIKDSDGLSVADLLALDDTDDDEQYCAGDDITLYHYQGDYRHFKYKVDGSIKPLLKVRMENGVLSESLPELPTIAAKVKAGLETLDASYKRLLNPHIYKVSISEKLRALKLKMIEECV